MDLLVMMSIVMDSIFYSSMQSNFPFQHLPTAAAVPLTSSCAWVSLIPGNAEADIFLEPLRRLRNMEKS